jgi:hypothetical protein
VIAQIFASTALLSLQNQAQLFCGCLEFPLMSREDPIQSLGHHLFDCCTFSMCDDVKLLHGLSIERIYWK